MSGGRALGVGLSEQRDGSDVNGDYKVEVNTDGQSFRVTTQGGVNQAFFSMRELNGPPIHALAQSAKMLETGEVLVQMSSGEKWIYSLDQRAWRQA